MNILEEMSANGTFKYYHYCHLNQLVFIVDCAKLTLFLVLK